MDVSFLTIRIKAQQSVLRPFSFLSAWMQFLLFFVSTTVMYSLGYLWKALMLMRHPFSFVIGMAAFILIVVHTSHTALYFTLSMLPASVLSFASILPSPCNFPFLGSSAFCSPPNTSCSPINNDLTCLQTTTFKQLQEHAGGTTSLAIMLRKMSAIGIPAMICSIDESNVISKEPIKASLTRVIEPGLYASQCVQSFYGSVQIGLNTVIGVNQATNDAVAELVGDVIDTFGQQVDNMNMAAAACSTDIQALSASLKAVANLLIDEKAFEKVEHQHLLSEFWTMLSGNRGRLAEYNEDIQILDAILKVEGYYMEGIVEVGFILDATSKDVVRLKLAFDKAVVSGKSFTFAGSAQGLVESVKHLLEFHAHFSRTQRQSYAPYCLSH
ncbi:hypothetical protein M422DRAFT_275157 [Sphaerobolus stellatus SS14]|uniref:Uncharacterized protein n=1 Tax=Sphaerobolus stellatus (strain SS14) TaxID=990650 RepID=A0A0C9TQB8_SPHS4|nr:hypothetical protein M422DRAFT_275157 [Sphaerobolus stellatus SS14]